jgi:OOP family OmpA-OmpF porin
MTKLLQSVKGVAISASALFIAFAMSGCGGTMAFQGEKAFTVSGREQPKAEEPKPAPAPEPEKKHVNIRKNKIEIDEKIQFEHDKAAILPASYGILDEVVKIMKENPQVKKILVEGHASSDGDAQHNLTLSDDRAKSVMNYLVEHGVEKTRLSAKGFGTKQPIADNATEAGREKNRRVEFTIEATDEKGAAK